MRVYGSDRAGGRRLTESLTRGGQMAAALGLVAAFLLLTSPAGAQGFDVPVPAALLMDAHTGQILFAKRADEPFRPASLAKVMTLLVALDAAAAGEVSLADPVRASARAAAIGGSQVYLAQGEVHTLEALLKAIAIAGANDASIAVAEHIAGTEEAFVQRMNERARRLSMANSLFINSHGLPPSTGPDSSWTSARDIARAARELIRLYPVVLSWTSVRVETFRTEPLFNLYNTNDMIGWYEGLDGLRTGYTSEAGYLIVATAQRGDVRLIAVVMAADSAATREQATRALLDYGFNRFEARRLTAGVVGTVTVPDGNPRQLPVRIDEGARVLVPRGGAASVETAVEPRGELRAPIAAGSEVGEYVVRVGGSEALRLPLYAAEDVERAGFWTRLWRGVLRLFGGE